MKKLYLVLALSALCLSFTGCSSDSAQNNLSRAIDGTERAVERGVDDVTNGVYDTVNDAERGWDNGTMTNGSNSEYYSDNYSGYNDYYYDGISGTKYGDDSGYQGYYDINYNNRNTGTIN